MPLIEPQPRPPSASRPLHRTPGAVGLVAAGGVLGAAARDALEQAVPASAAAVPAATLTANLAGALLLGLLMEALARSGADVGWRRRARLLAGTGFIGAFTTYSTFAVESDQLLRHHHPAVAVLYVAVTFAGGLIAVAVGILVASRLSGRRPGPAGGLPVDPSGGLPVDPDVDEAGGRP